MKAPISGPSSFQDSDFSGRDGRGQILQIASPSALPLLAMASSSQAVAASKCRFSRSTEFRYSTSFDSNEPLLAAGLRYEEALHLSRRVGLDPFDDQRTKVMRIGFDAPHQQDGLLGDVLPQGRPLRRLLPDIEALEHRHDVSKLRVEQGVERSRIRLHSGLSLFFRDGNPAEWQRDEKAPISQRMKGAWHKQELHEQFCVYRDIPSGPLSLPLARGFLFSAIL